ncbi:flagellar brake protein [Moritella sp. Urea-trap-13]|uniref:flagellar brake domain-containing protein n=1 Tax=Moritella sp. Urea-trap-13 TaxID=2058327 RepID=UPI001E632719|nr:flagellar brake protein [Moritella sp. Urea-trap-13]
MKITKPEPDIGALKLMHIGMRLLIEVILPNGIKSQATSRLIGYKKDDFILLEYPMGRDSGFDQVFLENASIIVRAITDTSFRDIVAFKTKINTIIYRPVKMLSLDMPINIATHKIREEPRVDAVYTVDIKCNGKKCLAKMINFSISGCGLVLENKDIYILKGNSITINLSISSDIKAELEGDVTSVLADSGQFKVGIKFNQNQLELKKEILHNIIIEMSNSGKFSLGGIF